MYRHEFLSAIHRTYRPRTYLEIGIDEGDGLRQSATRSIGIDPAYHVTAELACDLQLVRATSDDFFARGAPLDWFAEGVINLAFINGLHIFEAALRDFVNTERHATSNSVIVLDDMLPRSRTEAARKRESLSWTGDVFRVAEVLRRHRPDLVVLSVDTEPTGMVVVLGADPTNTTIADAFESIVDEFSRSDPQPVPDEILNRTVAADPDRLLAAPVWVALADARDSGSGRSAAVDDVRELCGTARYTPTHPDLGIWPVPANVADRVRGAVTRRVRRAMQRG